MALERVYGPLVGPRRDDLRAGVVASMIANVNRGPRDTATSAEDFVLRFTRPDPELAEAALDQIAKRPG